MLDDALGILDGWEEEHAEIAIRRRMDRELESSLLRDHLEHAERRAKMPAAIRRHEDGGEE